MPGDPSFSDCIAGLIRAPNIHTEALRMQREYGFDVYKLLDAVTNAPEVIWRRKIHEATPRDVWAEYAADGISPLDAIDMEMSYAG